MNIIITVLKRKTVRCPVWYECGYAICPHHKEHKINENCGENTLGKTGWCPACVNINIERKLNA